MIAKTPLCVLTPRVLCFRPHHTHFQKRPDRRRGHNGSHLHQYQASDRFQAFPAPWSSTGVDVDVFDTGPFVIALLHLALSRTLLWTLFIWAVVFFSTCGGFQNFTRNYFWSTHRERTVGCLKFPTDSHDTIWVGVNDKKGHHFWIECGNGTFAFPSCESARGRLTISTRGVQDAIPWKCEGEKSWPELYDLIPVVRTV